MVKKKNTAKTTKKDTKAKELTTIEVPITIGFDQTKVIGVAKVIVGEHLTMLPYMVLAPSYEVKDIELNEKGESAKREFRLLELSMITPQVANPTRIKKAE